LHEILCGRDLGVQNYQFQSCDPAKIQLFEIPHDYDRNHLCTIDLANLFFGLDSLRKSNIIIPQVRTIYDKVPDLLNTEMGVKISLEAVMGCFRVEENGTMDLEY
jgi:hypothetical protein